MAEDAHQVQQDNYRDGHTEEPKKNRRHGTTSLFRLDEVPPSRNIASGDIAVGDFAFIFVGSTLARTPPRYIRVKIVSLTGYPTV